MVRVVRAELRRRKPRNLSLSQLRALSYLTTHPGAPLSAVAEHVGVALPSASVLVAGLERRKLVTRLAASGARRRARSCYTPEGMRVDVEAVVRSNTRLSDDYNVVALDAPAIAERARPGQFVMIKPGRGTDPLLRRPFSIFEVVAGDDRARRCRRRGCTSGPGCRPRQRWKSRWWGGRPPARSAPSRSSG